jgi:hypothetical protein
MGAGNPRKCTHEPGAPTAFALPEEYGSVKAATDPGERGCAKPMHRVSASDFDELFVESKKSEFSYIGSGG